MNDDADNDEPTPPEWASDHAEPFDVAVIELMQRMRLDGAADYNIECLTGMGGIGPAEATRQDDMETDLTPAAVREATAKLVASYVRHYYHGFEPDSDPIHEAIGIAEQIRVDEFDAEEWMETRWDPPRILTVDSDNRLTVGLEWSPGSVRVYRTCDRETISRFDVLYNSYEGELYKVQRITEDTVILEVLNREMTIERGADFVTIDHDRIHPMEEI